jgi:hypothetical protein
MYLKHSATVLNKVLNDAYSPLATSIYGVESLQSILNIYPEFFDRLSSSMKQYQRES